MLGLIVELLTLISVFGPIICGFLLPIIRAPKGKITRWELASIVFGIAAGPLLLLAIPRNAGFGAIYYLANFELILPIWAIAIARSTRPVLFGMAGISGYFVSFVVKYFTSPPTENHTGPLLMIPTIFAYVAGPALVISIPFWIRARRFLKRREAEA